MSAFGCLSNSAMLPNIVRNSMAMANPSSFDILEPEPSLSWGIIVESLLSLSIAELESEPIVDSAVVASVGVVCAVLAAGASSAASSGSSLSHASAATRTSTKAKLMSNRERREMPKMCLL